MARAEWEIVVVDTSGRRFPSAARLVDVGVPLTVARKYQRERRHFTAGLKQMARENRN